MKNLKIILLALVFLWFGISGASAFTIDLFEYAFNIDGTVSDPTLGDPVPAAVDISLFDDITGIGTISVTISGAGAHNVDLFVDHEIDETMDTFFNEVGTTSGAPGAVESWEIDEPEFVFGDIYTNFEISDLDNSIGVNYPEDVSMALGWDFNLAAGETGLISFVISEDIADMLGGITLIQTDDETGGSIYFSSSLKIQPIPEPTTLLLLGIGLVGLAGFGRRKFRKQS